jgi:hypothetical protein
VRAGDALVFTPQHAHDARPPANAAHVSIQLRIVPANKKPAAPISRRR